MTIQRVNVGIVESNAVSFSSGGEHHSSDDLTCREKQVVAGICHALSNKQIGDTLGISESTVTSHIRSIMAKSKCSSRMQISANFGSRFAE